MGLLGTSAQAFTDNFLKTYMAIGEDRRAEASQKIAEKMRNAQMLEMQQQEALRQAQMREIQAQTAQRENALQQDASMYQDMANLPVQVNMKGLMSSGIIDPKTQSSDPRALQQIASGQMPTGYNVGLLGAPTTQDQLNVLTKYNPEKALSIRAQMENTTSNNEMRLALEQLRQQGANNRQAIKINVGGGGMSYGDKIAIKDRYKSLSKAETKAQDSIFKVEQYDTLIDSLQKGNVGGFEGGIKAFLAPVAESLGIDVSGKMGEAQAFKLMSRALIGDMRLDLVGSGPVSDAEQKLLSKLSGGDINVSRKAATDLFKIYRSRATNNITQYHNQYDLLSKRYPDIKGTFMRFDDVVGKNEAQPQKNSSRDTSQLKTYISTNASKFSQTDLLTKMRNAGWSDAEIAAEWRAYSGKR